MARSNAAVAAAAGDWRRALVGVAGFSVAVNLLMLASPLYMLQVYDRVLASRSVPTLVALSIFLFGALLFQWLFDVIRGRVLVRAAVLVDQHLSREVHRAVAEQGRNGARPEDATQPARDLDQVRTFLSGGGPIALIDLPWVPVFLLVCYLIHPWLGGTALAGTLVMVALTLAVQWQSREAVRSAQHQSALRGAHLEALRGNSETLVAMGMEEALAARWAEIGRKHLAAVRRAADVISSYGSASRAVRYLLQSAIIGVGAYLVIGGELLAGAMIAASITMGRALAPVESAISNWRGFVGCRDAVRRLLQTLDALGDEAAGFDLPAPVRDLTIAGLSVVPPGGERVSLANVAFSLTAGDGLAILGPSGAGKTSLLRALAGVWSASRGSVRLDGAQLEQWRAGSRGAHVGYMAQTIELFDGTIAENIARLGSVDATKVVAAAQAAGAHDLILRLANGYETRIGSGGSRLSAGQRQRLALARALYGDPFLIVLDEPNANLDADGEKALGLALKAARDRGAIVVVAAHRPTTLSACNKILVLGNGVQQAFGPSEELLAAGAVKTATAVGAFGLRVVGERRDEPNERNL